jgi:hypothetical protein
MGAVKQMIEEFAGDDAYKGHPWDPNAAAHYAKEPEMTCEISNRRFPVSELVRTETGTVISAEVWNETEILLERIRDAVYALEVDADEGYEPDPDSLQIITDSAAALNQMWNR